MTVYVTHGRKYHVIPDCPALEMGQNLHDYDCDCWTRCEHAKAWAIQDTTEAFARGAGKTACSRCYPDPVPLAPSVETFGHEPFEYDGVPICARCCETVTHYDEAYQASRWTRPVPWPCTSAVVLGLAPRPAS